MYWLRIMEILGKCTGKLPFFSIVLGYVLGFLGGKSNFFETFQRCKILNFLQLWWNPNPNIIACIRMYWDLVFLCTGMYRSLKKKFADLPEIPLTYFQIKCERYWPLSGSERYRNFTVTLQMEYHYANYVEREFMVTKGSKAEVRKIRYVYCYGPPPSLFLTIVTFMALRLVYF